MSDEIDEVGHCPICRSLMVEMGKFVVCPAGHYRAAFDAWHWFWVHFDPRTGDADYLIKDLLDLNVVTVDAKEVEKIQEAVMEEK